MIRSTVRKSWAGILSLFLFAVPGFTETYQIDPSHSSVEFSVRHIFSQVSGKFKTFSGVIQYDPKSLENASVEATIKVASIDTDNEKRDNHLKSPDFFDAEKYPEITFKSESVKNQEGGLLLKGDLTMHGVTKSVLVLVEVLGGHPSNGQNPYCRIFCGIDPQTIGFWGQQLDRPRQYRWRRGQDYLKFRGRGQADGKSL